MRFTGITSGQEHIAHVQSYFPLGYWALFGGFPVASAGFRWFLSAGLMPWGGFRRFLLLSAHLVARF